MKITIAYIPVIHRGHQEFFQKVSPDVLYVLGKSFLSEFNRLDRDIRALDPQAIVIACRAFNFANKVEILEKKDIDGFSKSDIFIFPEDEVMHLFVDNYLAGISVKFEKIFLRWDKMAALTANPVGSEIVISKNDFDKEFMNKARKNAIKSSDWWRQIGAVIVKNGEAILQSFNQHKPSENAPYIDGDPRSNFDAGEHMEIFTSLHAEAGLIAKAAREGISLSNCSIYISTFPCPNCAMQIIEAGIKKLYYADGYSNLNALDNLRIAEVQIIQVKDS